MIGPTLSQTTFDFHPEQSLYKGKVRDVYSIGPYIIMIASDRISAFDHILNQAIPFKGQVLNQLAGHFLDATSDIVPNWKITSPDPNVTIGYKAQPFKIELVVRGYLTGHAWRTYSSGIRTLCGITLPDGMRENDRFIEPIITPTTKADQGHDLDISAEDILKQSLATEEQWHLLTTYALDLFNRGTQMALDRGLILVDTKYEFGLWNDSVILIDEIHTPDSSRYFIADGYDQHQSEGTPQKQMSKEFVREWLMAHNFQGLDGQIMPDLPESFVEEVSDRYIQLYESLTGHTFIKANGDRHDAIMNSVKGFLHERYDKVK